jgi:putative aldouronate transport system permease protein
VVKRSVQTILYLPHFFSWVIIAGFCFQLLGSNGPINMMRSLLGAEPRLYLQIESFFRPIVVGAGIYRDAGWGTIIYLAAMAGINPELYEAATIDGATRFQRIVWITVPCVLPTTAILLLLRFGSFMNFGFDRIWVFLTPMTYRVGDIFDTFVYRVGITQGEYSLTTAIGLFQSAVGLTLIVGVNRLTKRVSGGLW